MHSFVTAKFGNNVPESCAALVCTIRRSTTLQFYCIPSVRQYPEQRIKWVTADERKMAS